MILHLKNSEIEKKKWDDAIDRLQNHVIYAKSWYLDIVSPNWEAFVSDDYENILPIPVKIKYGIRTVVQPIYCQQLGLFSKNNDLLPDFFNKLKRNFLLVRYSFNDFNDFSFFKNSSQKNKRITHLLNLDADYDSIKKNYSTNCRRNCKKAENSNQIIESDINIDEILDLQRMSSRIKYDENYFFILKQLCKEGTRRDSVEICGVRNEDGNLIAAVVWLLSGNRHIYLSANSTSEGLEKHAMFYLVDMHIKKYAKSSIMIDFEGSMIESISRFYQGFGAKPENYYYIKTGKLFL